MNGTEDGLNQIESFSYPFRPDLELVLYAVLALTLLFCAVYSIAEDIKITRKKKGRFGIEPASSPNTLHGKHNTKTRKQK